MRVEVARGWLRGVVGTPPRPPDPQARALSWALTSRGEAGVWHYILWATLPPSVKWEY